MSGPAHSRWGRRGAALRVEYLERPGRWMTDEALASLLCELKVVGQVCLEPLPDYQVFVGTRAACEDKILTLARGPDGRLLGFCSAVLLSVPLVGEVLHLGLICVLPEARGARVSNALCDKLVARYCLGRPWGGDVWLTNVACVLSVLGNLAQYFPEVYPSPWHPRPFAPEVALIAQTFDVRYRHVAHVQPDANFDWDTYVFRGSGRGTAFQKEVESQELHHRNQALNDFYANMIRFNEGDEMLQVIRFRIGDLIKHKLRPWQTRPWPAAAGGERAP